LRGQGQAELLHLLLGGEPSSQPPGSFAAHLTQLAYARANGVRGNECKHQDHHADTEWDQSHEHRNSQMEQHRSHNHWPTKTAMPDQEWKTDLHGQGVTRAESE